MKPVVLAIVGPTGSGKTGTAIRLCQRMNAEIVSMDSMQIYRRMDIGTAKPSKEEQSAARHHMIDIVEPDQLFTVSMYRERAIQVIDDIIGRGKLPILVGGTGLYLQALSYEMSLGENGANCELREKLNKIASESGGPDELHRRLSEIDPLSAKKLHPHDTRRVIRALEIFETTGKMKGEQGEQANKEGPYHIMVYGLSMPRDLMYARINKRVDQMIACGLVDEVRTLLQDGISPRKEGGAMQAIGYKEIVSALQGEICLDDAISLIKQGSRRYAKRQWTWFRRDERTQWFDWTTYDSSEALLESLYQKIQMDISAYITHQS